MHLRKNLRRSLVRYVTIVTVALSLLVIGGCERREKVIDVETPLGDVEVDRAVAGGDVDVEVDVDEE